MKKKILTPWTQYVQRKAQAAKHNLTYPHVTPRVSWCVHVKFHADWSKPVGARGIHTDTQTDR